MCEAVGDLKSPRLRGEELALRDGENVLALDELTPRRRGPHSRES
jgi:hypothetical protein